MGFKVWAATEQRADCSRAAAILGVLWRRVAAEGTAVFNQQVARKLRQELEPLGGQLSQGVLPMKPGVGLLLVGRPHKGA